MSDSAVAKDEQQQQLQDEEQPSNNDDNNVAVTAVATAASPIISDEVLHPPLSKPTLRLDGRIFIITGGTQGLGLAIAKLLIEQGAIGLVLVSRNRVKGEQIANELSSSSKCRCIYMYCDLQNAKEVEQLVPNAAEQYFPHQTITGLINAAATTARGNLMTETADGFDTQMAINVRAPFLLTQSLAKHIRSNDDTARVGGSIVNICSCAVYGGAPFIMSYTASKAALATLTKTNAHELAPHNIRVNAINMGWCCTDNEHAIQSRFHTNWLPEADASCPLGRILRPADVACLVNFLLSDAAIMMTGTVLEYHPEYPHGMISLATHETDGR